MLSSMRMMAPQLFHLSGTHFNASAKGAYRSIHFGKVALAGKKTAELSAQDRVLYIDEHNHKSEMTVENLLHLAESTEGRFIYKVGIVGLDSGLPAFKLMNARELEIAVSKARTHATGQSFQRLDPQNLRVENRVKEKKYKLKSTTDKNQVLAYVQKMCKELEKGSIVRVSIESKGHPSDTKDIEKMINDGLKQVLESSNVIKSSFFLEIREGRKR